MEHKEFSLPCIRPLVPRTLRPWMFVLVAVCLQTLNVVYLPSMGNMAGDRDLHHEDVTLCLYAAFAGMNIAFPMMWRFKFRFTTRQILTICFTTLIVCNLVTAYSAWMPLLVAASFVGGFMKIWGTFESISTINPWLAPGLDFPRFFPILYMMILCPIYLTAIIDTPLTYFTASWQSMHWLAVGVLLALLLMVRLLMVDFFPMGRGPLIDFDFLGLILWGLLMMQMSFIAIYGEHYNWLHSGEIRLAIGTCCLTAAICLWRMRYCQHPYIKWDALVYRRIPVGLLLFFLLDAMMETPNSLQNILTTQLLHFDILALNHLNVSCLLGTLCGCLFSLAWLWRWHLPILRLAFVGFLCALAYQAGMYFLTAPTTSLHLLHLPVFIRTFGYACVYASLTLYLKELIPFDHFLQVLAIVGVVRSGIGGSVGEAIYGYGLRLLMSKNTAHLSSYMGHSSADAMPLPAQYADVMQQALQVSIKELWGYTVVACIVLYTIILLFDSPATARLRRRR